MHIQEININQKFGGWGTVEGLNNCPHLNIWPSLSVHYDVVQYIWILLTTVVETVIIIPLTLSTYTLKCSTYSGVYK